ncbi:hypothetical protein JCM11491_001994, partial [Sporobolomyces phaffii]
SLGGVLELAANNDSMTVLNQNTFQFYALDAYAYDVVWPGKSCVTANPPHDEASHGAAAATTTSSAASTAEATATATSDAHADHDHSASQEAASATTSAAESCHTHSDGEIHCF